MRKSALYIALTLFAAYACNKPVMEPQKMGAISLALSSDQEVVVSTKADAVDCSDFLVDIYGTTFLGQAYATEQYVYKSMPDEIVIPYGYYTVSAQNCLEETAASGFGCARYYGSSDQVDVFSQEVETVTVKCTMANGKVTMTFDDGFLEDFSDVTVDVTATRTVTMTSSQANAPSDLYFNVPETGAQLIYAIHGTVAKDTESERRLTYTNASSPMTLYPAKWAKITIKSNHNGLIGPGVIVDGDMDNDSYTEVIDPEDGDTAIDGAAGLPSILVDTQIDDAKVIDCDIDIL